MHRWNPISWLDLLRMLPTRSKSLHPKTHTHRNKHTHTHTITHISCYELIHCLACSIFMPEEVLSMDMAESAQWYWGRNVTLPCPPSFSGLREEHHAQCHFISAVLWKSPPTQPHQITFLNCYWKRGFMTLAKITTIWGQLCLTVCSTRVHVFHCSNRHHITKPALNLRCASEFELHMCVCVCVCVCKRERVGGSGQCDGCFEMLNVLFFLPVGLVTECRSQMTRTKTGGRWEKFTHSHTHTGTHTHSKISSTASLSLAFSLTHTHTQFSKHIYRSYTHTHTHTHTHTKLTPSGSIALRIKDLFCNTRPFYLHRMSRWTHQLYMQH